MKLLLIILGVVLAIILFVVFVLFTAADRTVIFGARESFSHNGEDRLYRINVPSVVDNDTKVIVAIHGFSDTARRFAYYTGLHNVADSDIVLYPDSLPGGNGYSTGWNAGFCCGSGWAQDADDVGFIAALTESIRDQYGVNPGNVFVTGFSNGAFMAQRMVTERPDLYAAIASVSGSIGTKQKRLEPETPVPILLMHGQKDTIVPFVGGEGSSDPNFTWLDFAATQSTWELVNGDQAETAVRLYPENGHTWDGWRLLDFWQKQPTASQEINAFFDRQ